MARTQEEMNDLLFELKADMNDFLVENFDMELNIPVRINGRLKRAAGQFFSRKDYFGFSGGYQPLEITIAKHAMQDYSYDEILSVAKHECVHYALCAQRKPFHDRDAYFIETCQRLNVPLYDESDNHKLQVYTCGKGCYVTRHRKLNGFYEGRYSCVKHSEDISYVGCMTKSELVNLKTND